MTQSAYTLFSVESKPPNMPIHFSGTGIVSPLGDNVGDTFAAIQSGSCGVGRVEEWASVEGLGTHVAALVQDFDARFIPRKTRREAAGM